VQRFHTLPFVLTWGAACGSGASGPTTAPAEPTETVRATVRSDAGGTGITSDLALPALACDDGTRATPAAFPEPTWFCARADGTRHGRFFTLFPDHTIRIEGTYEDGKLAGAWKRYHPGGALAEQGTYVAGLPDGSWRQLARDGTLLGDYTLAAGTGKQRRWLDDGPLYSEQTLTKGTPNGPLTVRDRDGTVVIRARFQQGKLDGDKVVGSKQMLRVEETFRRGVRTGPRKIWQFWALLVDERYDASGRLDGAFALWRDKKTPRLQGQYDRGKRAGRWVWTDRWNNKEREGTYAAGKKTGTWTEYSEGKLTYQGAFRDGKPDGEHVYYDRSGRELGRFTMRGGTGTKLTFHPNKKPSSRVRMKNGLLDGAYEELSFTGKLLVEGSYAADRKHGRWREWTAAGVLVHEAHYNRGKLDGTVKKYAGTELVLEASYKDGQADGPYTEYRDGKKSLAGQYIADRKVGTWTAYDASGAVTLVATYTAGMLDGPWRQHSATGTREGSLSLGRRSGSWTQADRSGPRRAP
jgi:antitoxin component YwqK of YwqJK toxin-antitoxin module